MSIDPRSLKAPDPSQWDEYDKPHPMVPAGRYTGRVPDTITIEADDEGFIKVILDPIQIVDAPPGYRDQVRFVRVGSRPRTTGRLAGSSQLTDFLLATGTEPVRSADPADWIAAIESTAGQLFDFFVDWRAYDKTTEKVLADTYEDFPTNGDGQKTPYITNPETGQRVAAQYRVRYYIRSRGRG